VQNGEGVYGLRRTLVLAGSESQMMSLWQVSDEATRSLMVSYYKRLLRGEGRTEALRQVQLEMLKSNDQTGRPRLPRDKLQGAMKTDYSHPYYWAAFIQSGDWRSLEPRLPLSPR
jgi:CHAT domain-containing protein